MKKIKIGASVLRDGLEPLTGIISDTHMMPILQCVKVVVENGVMKLEGDNLETSCVKELKVKSDDFGFCVRFSTFFQIINSLNEEEITLEIGDGEIKLLHKHGDFKLPTFDVEDFPHNDNDELTGKAKVDGGELRAALRVAIKFSVNDQLDPISNVSIQIGKSIIVRATNRSTLFYEELKGKGDETKVLMSGKSCSTLAALLDEKKVTIEYNERVVVLSGKDYHVRILQQEGEFPFQSFDAVLDAFEEKDKIKIDVDELKAALKRASIVSDSSNFHKVVFHIKKKELLMVADNKGESSNAKETLKCKFKDERDVAYNLKFLQEVMSVFADDYDVLLNSRNLLGLQNEKRRGIVANVQLKDA